jgi:hypothetical protein
MLRKGPVDQSPHALRSGSGARIEKPHVVKSKASVTGRFISAVRRRMVVVRVAESVAVGVGVAAAVGLGMIPIFWWRGQSGLAPGLAILSLGAFCGLLRGITRIPTGMQAAVEADRQLNLHDLLSTVHSLANPADSWEASLAAIGEGRCRRLRPSAVVVGHLGLRAWGGVGILGSLLLTLGLFTSRPVSVRAADSAWQSNPPVGPHAIQPSPGIAFDSPRMDRPPGPGGTDDMSNRGFEQDRADDSHTGAPSNANSVRNPSSGDSTGGGAAITGSHLSPQPLPMADAATGGSHAGGLGTGAGPSDAQARMPGDSNSVSGSPAKSNAHAPPWQSGRWFADVAAAQSDIAAGRVPDSDADLVRDYFRRQ